MFPGNQMHQTLKQQYTNTYTKLVQLQTNIQTHTNVNEQASARQETDRTTRPELYSTETKYGFITEF